MIKLPRPHRVAAGWVSLLMSLLAYDVNAETITLKLQHFLGEDSIPHTALVEPWAQRVEAESKGRISVEIHPAMTLGGKADELVDQVQNGVVDIVWTAAAYTPGRFPRSEVFTLPLVHRGDPAATNLAIMELLQPELKPDYPGLHPLLVHVHQGHAFHMSGGQVASLEQFRGLTLRPPGRGIGSWTIEALGAKTTKKRHPKLPKAMTAGDLDGALMSFNLAQSMGVIEAAKSHTLLGEREFFGTSLFLFLMNDRRYRSLPADLRQVIDNNSGQAFAREMGDVWMNAGNAGISAARTRGNKINVLREAERAKTRILLEGVTGRWLRERQRQRIDGAHLIDSARRAIARHSDE
ncbi:MAG: TRAP transporter substrate-binding protein [Gammaproteobacteria bacterium]|nr:TRAP transporter substrate-binding protein [Gammaproteobacteria bacterium]